MQLGTKCPWIRATLPRMLSTRSATALYVGAVLGPGVLFLPALAAEAAGPASVLAWAALLALSVPLAITFAALGVRQPEAGGTAAYARAAFGPRAGAVDRLVVPRRRRDRRAGRGADRRLLRRRAARRRPRGRGRRRRGDDGRGAGGQRGRAAHDGAAAARARRPARRAAARRGRDRAAARAAPRTGRRSRRTAGRAVGSAASLLMLSFIGWEAVSHLAGELRDPARQLPRAIFAALGVVVVLYLGLAVATVGVLGTAAPSDVPLADLMAAGLGEPGRTVTAVLAVLLTMGDDEHLRGRRRSSSRARWPTRARRPPALARPSRALALFAPSRRGPAGPAGRRTCSSARRASCAPQRVFVAVYVTATAAGVRLLDGAARRGGRRIAFAAVLVVLAFSGPYLLVPAARSPWPRRRRRTSTAAFEGARSAAARPRVSTRSA